MKYFLLGLILFSCTSVNQRNKILRTAEPIDTILAQAPHIVSKPDLFESAFVKGTIHKVNNIAVYLYGTEIGKLKITAGKIVAADPGHLYEYGIPFNEKFPIGQFPVQLAIAKVEYQEAIAYARIKFNENPVVRWEYALKKNEKPISIFEKQVYGYSTDIGLGSFMDEIAKDSLLSKKGMDSYESEVYKDFNKHWHNDWRFAIYQIGENNAAFFTSGFGDGFYSTYIGVDSTGAICRLLTDFELFDWRNEQEK